MNKRLLLISFILISLLLVPTISALDLSDITKLDNIDTYTKLDTYGKYDIRNSILGIPFLQLDKVEEIELIENSDMCGEDCYAIKKYYLSTKGQFF